jgi:predicted O-linked N-acetylglucosamine transferase (SPINDLY family)
MSLSIFQKATTQKIIAEKWTRENTPSEYILPKFSGERKSEKIRVGYYSPDFKNHPVSFLIAELIELHDRNRFDVIGFSFGSDNLNPMQDRMRNSFDQFLDVRNRSDLEIASLSREMGIDIAIDLCGHTHENRFGIFCHRAAPAQVSYLGHPGTMGATCIDYIIADPILIPIEKSFDYTEKLVHLPHSFQINDRKRLIGNLNLNKSDFGLPESGTIYCCFNNNFKITPDIFYSWMQILKGVDSSVLWLLEDAPSVAINLRKEALKAGVDPARVFFAGRIARELYLGRYRLADIFLDTSPFNGGATASDALWAGLPIITKIGDAYAGRMAASLLNAIGLPELITQTDEEYIQLAQNLGRNPSKLTSIKTKLAHNKLSMPLFDTPLNVRYIEEAFEKMMERYWSNQTPDHIKISP